MNQSTSGLPTESPPPSGDGVAEGAGLGAAGLVLFIVVVIIVIIVRRRYTHDLEEEEGEETDSGSEDDDPVKLQMKLFRNRASEADIQRMVGDQRLLAVIKELQIDVSRLALSRQLGKGRTDFLRSSLRNLKALRTGSRML